MYTGHVTVYKFLPCLSAYYLILSSSVRIRSCVLRPTSRLSDALGPSIMGQIFLSPPCPILIFCRTLWRLVAAKCNAQVESHCDVSINRTGRIGYWSLRNNNVWPPRTQRTRYGPSRQSEDNAPRSRYRSVHWARNYWRPGRTRPCNILELWPSNYYAYCYGIGRGHANQA